VEVRLARQSVLTRDDEPAQLVAVIDESVLRRVVGGPQVMASQLEHIVEICDHPNVTLHVFPFEYGVTPGVVAASHRILHFAGSEPPVVYMEAVGEATWIEDRVAVDAHDLAFEQVVGGCLTSDESIEMVRRAAADYAAR
jgi:hypothetical protein